MSGLKTLTRNNLLKILVLLLTITFLLYSFPNPPSPRIAGRAGDSGVSTASSGSTRWGLEAVKAKDAWKVTKGSDEVVVAIIDSGIDKSIPAIRERMWKNQDEIPGDGIDNDGNGYVDDVHGWDFRERDSLEENSGSLHYHGTFVGGLVASSYDQKTGAGGVAPNISLMDLRFLDSGGRFFTSDWQKLSDAVDYAVDNGADIINFSVYASVNPPDSVRQAMKRAESEGVLIVGISGNNGSRLGYFGAWDEIFTVGAIDKSYRVSDFSNYGPEVELVAPGEQVLSFKPGGKLANGSGTSFAAPHVAGSAALILSKNPELGLSELKQALRDSARDIGDYGKDEQAGHGIIDTHKSLSTIATSEEPEISNQEFAGADEETGVEQDSNFVTLQTGEGRKITFKSSEDI
ncbi:MAG: S8 family serine peptidase [Candidatus Bipolaricaulota bacterium]